ncbi:MAG: hypothetical protein ACI8PZ_003411 [Myxococcota bacterium]
MSLSIRASNAIQLWCLRHPNPVSSAVLTAFNGAELISYSMKQQDFLTRRVELFGPNFAAVGKLHVGEHAEVVGLLAAPQQRGVMIGQARFVADRMPRGMPLFMSDDGATGGTGAHGAVHGAIWRDIAKPGQDRLSSPVLAGYVDEAVAQLVPLGRQPKDADARPIIQRMVIRFMMYVLFGMEATPEQVESLYEMFYGSSPSTSYTLSAAKPMAPAESKLAGLNASVAAMLDAIVAAPALRDYAPDPATGSLSAREWAELLLAIIGVAAFGGGGNLAVSAVCDIPTEFAIDLSDRDVLLRAILEVGRIFSPVGNFNLITDAPSEYTVSGKNYTFPKGTVVAGVISVASVDPTVFPDPLRYDPTRENLLSGFVNFNGVGFDAERETSTRTCPGRNIAVAMASKLLVAWRTARPA